MASIHISNPQSDVETDEYSRVASETFDRLDGRVVLATPLGVGKSVRLVNAMVDHAMNHRDTSLTIITALTLSAEPQSNSEIARRLASPILERMSSGGPEPIWERLRRNGGLPDNIDVRDFYLNPGADISVPSAQQSYVSANYHHVIRLLADMNTNVLAQLVSPPRDGILSLGTNPDVSLRLIEMLETRREEGEQVALLAEAASEMPHLKGDALIDADRFDVIIAQTEPTPLFGIPNPPVGLGQAAVGILAAALIRDGGSLQIGIGSLGDAVAAGVDLRHRDPDRFSQAVVALAPTHSQRLIAEIGGRGSFELGVYVATEMLSDALLELHRSGVVSRRVTRDPVVQTAINSSNFDRGPGVALLESLAVQGVIEDPMSAADVARLADAGILVEGLHSQEDKLFDQNHQQIDPAIGPHLESIIREEIDGPAIHAAFAAGSPRFYETLREKTDQIALEMGDVGYTNTLLGSEGLKRAQRREMRFVNATMQVTLLGEAASDTLPDGRVVSGVGGQHDFVTQAFDLDGARSVIVARAVREADGATRSNIVWSHPHPTIPRHLRDIVVTEYGVADIRGRSDAETIAAIVEIADSRFQPELVAKAKGAGKLPESYEVPVHARHNTPQRIETTLSDRPIDRYPFGSVLTKEEDELRQGLSALSNMSFKPETWPSWDAVKTARDIPERMRPHLKRLNLDSPKSFKERMMAAAVVVALEESGVIRDE